MSRAWDGWMVGLASWMCAAGAAAAPGAEWRAAPTHPRVFITLEEVAALRVRCGVGGSAPAEASGAAFGSMHDAYERLKQVGEGMLQAPAGWDDLYVPAMLHLAGEDLAKPDEYTRYVAAELSDPSRERIGLDGLTALDWCWDAMEAKDRTTILRRLEVQIEPLDGRHSPLDPFVFGRRLESLAAAVVLSEADCRDHAALHGKLEVVRSEALEYFGEPFRRFCRERGAMPTSPDRGIREEADIVLACELWRSATGENLLGALKDSAGRMLEHYFYADTEHPALAHGFIHDDGSRAPQRPASLYRGFAPALPHVLARFAGDPVAAWYALRSLPVMAGISPEADRYLWARLLYGGVVLRPAPRKAMPLGRDFGGGWVAMRSGWTPGATVLLFDAGQPYWRSRQHYDAGQFQIYRKGRLAIDSGDDVAFQAVLDQQGQTLVGGRPGDWDHYAQSTIAHNCLTVVDPHFQQSQYGRVWSAIGNQRIVEHNYSPGQGEIGKTPRRTGTLTAFETNSFYSYAAADLTAAYPAETVLEMRRQILFVNAGAGAALVLDRVESIKPDALKTWHLQLAARPVLLAGSAGAGRLEAESGQRESRASAASEAVAAAPEPPSGSGAAAMLGARQLHGRDQSAGIWELDAEHAWVGVTSGEGRLFVCTLLPAGAERRVVGGPMEMRTIAGGPLAGRSYVGGDPFGYEYRLWPAHFLKAPSASYELGSPVGLGPQFGAGAAWGRFDVSAPPGRRAAVFLHVLIPADAGQAEPPPLVFAAQEDRAHVEITLGDQAARVDWSLEKLDGLISIRHALTGNTLYEKELARRVER